MPDSVLVVKIAAIGDVVMALPMVTAVRERAPQARLAWLCGRTVAPLLRRVQGIDETIVVDDVRLLAGSRLDRARVVAGAWLALRGRRFDAVYVAHTDPRYRLLARGARAGTLRALDGTGLRAGPLPGRHHADEYVRLVTGLDDHRAAPCAPPAVDVALPAALAEHLPAGRPLVALAPGGARNAAREDGLRRWPLDRYAALAQRLLGDGCPVVLVGAASDAWVREAFAGLPVVDLVGATDLPALVALFARCAAVVTHDSGPLHLADLAGTPRVALFGPTPPRSFVRDDARTRLLWPGAALPCAPCYDGRGFAACARNLCMEAIGVDAVAAGVRALLASG